MMYGHRARIGYTSVAYVTEVFPYSFYKIAPEGITLSLLTLHQTRFGPEEMSRLYDETIRSAHAFAMSGVDLIVLGGRPVLLSKGAAHLERLLVELPRSLGVPVTTDATAQLEAFKALGARRVATVHPFSEDQNPMFEPMIKELGLEPAGVLAGGSSLPQLPTLDISCALEWGRKMKKLRPDADTLLFPCPHWAVIEAIEPLERELKVNVVTNLQTTLWHALRLCGVNDKIKGYGRLLEEF
jgi:maleate cis-trans isomerase